MSDPAKSSNSRPLLPWERAAQQADASARRAAEPPASQAPPQQQPPSGDNSFAALKGRIHRRLLERLNLSNLDKLTREQVTEAIRKVVLDLIAQESAPLNF